MKAGAYLRKSNVEKGKKDEEKSVAQQLVEARKIAKARGWPLDDRHVFRDNAVSGGIMDRPGLMDAMKAVAAKRFDVLLVWELERLGRPEVVYPMMALYGEMVKAGVNLLHLCDEDRTIDLTTDAGQFEVFMKSHAAGRQRVSAKRSARRGLHQAHERGGFTGGRCYGYRLVPKVLGPDGGVLTHSRQEVDAAEARVVRWIFRRAAEGGKQSTIARELNDRGTPAPRAGSLARGRDGGPPVPSSGKWNASSVRNILTKPRYRGVVTWGGERRTDDRLRIVDEGLWKRADAAMKVAREASWRTRDGKHIRGRPPSGKHPVARFVDCAACGGPMKLNWNSTRPNAKPYLRCGRRERLGDHGCKNSQGILVADAEAAILDGAAKALVAESIVARVAELDERRKQVRVDPRGIKADIAQLERDNANMLSSLKEGVVPALASKINAEAAANNARIEHLQGLLIGSRGTPKAAARALLKELRAITDDWRAHLRKNPATTQLVLGKILGREKILLSPPARKGGRWRFRFPVDYEKLLREVTDPAWNAALAGYFWTAHDAIATKPEKVKSSDRPSDRRSRSA